MKRSLLLAAALGCAVSACNAKFINTRFKGMVTPVSVSWDVAFMGQFERNKDFLARALNEEDLPQDVKDEISRVLKKGLEEKKASFVALVRGLVSQDRKELLDAIFAAGEFLFPPEMKAQRDFVVNMLEAFLKTSDDYKVRSHALLSLTKLGVLAREDAKNLLRSKEPIERFVAAYHFKVLGEPEDIPALKRALSIEGQPRVVNMLKQAIDAIEARDVPPIVPRELKGE